MTTPEEEIAALTKRVELAEFSAASRGEALMASEKALIATQKTLIATQKTLKAVESAKSKPKNKVLQSDRGIQLIWGSKELPLVPTLTVEMYCKWYTLWLVHPDGTVGAVEYPDNLRGESSMRDHVPNPKAVELLAEEKGWDVDEVALETITGRWSLEA